MMHYLDVGEGPVVLLLHGNPTWCYFYRNLIGELKDRFRVIAPDYVGCGLSSKPQKPYCAVDRVEHLEALLKHLEVDRFSLVCHDWGGPIGTFLALQKIDRVEKIVYLNTTLTEVESLPFFMKMVHNPLICQLVTKTFNGFITSALKFGTAKKLPKRVREGYYFPYRTSASRGAVFNFVREIPFSKEHPAYRDLTALSAKISLLHKIPVQIIWGLKDPCFHKGMLEKLKRDLPHASVLEIPYASHFILEDEPILANAAIRRFLLTGEGVTTPFGSSESSAPNEFYQAFLSMVNQYPDEIALIEPRFFLGKAAYKKWRYRELYACVNRCRRELAHWGLKKGDKVLMLVPPGFDFLVFCYAVVGSGAIPVFIDPGIGKEKLFTCIKNLEPDVFIGSPKAQLLRLKPSLFTKLKFHLTCSPWMKGHFHSFSSEPLPFASASTITLIAFTSGATGLPKGVVFTGQMLQWQLALFQTLLEGENRNLPLLPIFSIFIPCLGGCSVIPPLDPAKPLSLDPKKILRVIKECAVSSSFGSPTLWQKIASYAAREHETLDPVQKIFIAGAPVPKTTIALVKSVLSKGEAYIPYGSAEALPVTCISGTDLLKHEDEAAVTGEIGTYVGKAISGTEIKIIKAVDEEIPLILQSDALPLLTIGEIIVKGPQVSPYYFYDNRLMTTGKIEDGKSFWHRMGDMGYLGSDGGLYFCGRKSYVVKVGQKIYHTIPLERLFNTHPRVKRSALVSIAHGKAVGIVIEPKDWPVRDRAAFIEDLKRHVRGTLAEEIQNFYFHPSFPVDSRHNAKIFRDQLGEFATKEEKG